MGQQKEWQYFEYFLVFLSLKKQQTEMKNGNSTQLSLLQLPSLDYFRRSYVSYRSQNSEEQTRGKIFTFLSSIFPITATESKNLTELPWYQFPRFHKTCV